MPSTSPSSRGSRPPKTETGAVTSGWRIRLRSPGAAAGGAGRSLPGPTGRRGVPPTAAAVGGAVPDFLRDVGLSPGGSQPQTSADRRRRKMGAAGPAAIFNLGGRIGRRQRGVLSCDGHLRKRSEWLPVRSNVTRSASLASCRPTCGPDGAGPGVLRKPGSKSRSSSSRDSSRAAASAGHLFRTAGCRWARASDTQLGEHVVRVLADGQMTPGIRIVQGVMGHSGGDGLLEGEAASQLDLLVEKRNRLGRGQSQFAENVSVAK